jgi:hypothetical protein
MEIYQTSMCGYARVDKTFVEIAASMDFRIPIGTSLDECDRIASEKLGAELRSRYGKEIGEMIVTFFPAGEKASAFSCRSSFAARAIAYVMYSASCNDLFLHMHGLSGKTSCLSCRTDVLRRQILMNGAEYRRFTSHFSG